MCLCGKIAIVLPVVVCESLSLENYVNGIVIVVVNAAGAAVAVAQCNAVDVAGQVFLP